MASARNNVWTYVAGATACIVLGMLGFTGDHRVPLLAWIDLGIHESGHIFTLWLSRPANFMAGTVAQILVPLAMAAYFAARRRDVLGTALCLAWAGTSAGSAAVYIADAPTEALPLVGGGEHDWAYLLGPEVFDAIDRAGAVGSAVNTAGVLLVIAGTALCLVGPVFMRDRHSVPVPHDDIGATSS